MIWFWHMWLHIKRWKNLVFVSLSFNHWKCEFYLHSLSSCFHLSSRSWMILLSSMVIYSYIPYLMIRIWNSSIFFLQFLIFLYHIPKFLFVPWFDFQIQFLKFLLESLHQTISFNLYFFTPLVKIIHKHWTSWTKTFESEWVVLGNFL